MRWLIRILALFLTPVLLIFGGAWTVSWGLEIDVAYITFAGAVMILAGLAWGAILIFFNTGGSIFD